MPCSTPMRASTTEPACKKKYPAPFGYKTLSRPLLRWLQKNSISSESERSLRCPVSAMRTSPFYKRRIKVGNEGEKARPDEVSAPVETAGLGNQRELVIDHAG